MSPPLDASLQGAFAPWRELVRVDEPADDGTSLPAATLLEADVARDLVARFAATYPGADRRSVVSMWSQWYFGALVVPAAASLLVLDRVLPVALAEMRLAFHQDGRPRALLLAHGGCSAAEAPGERLGALLDDHVAPLIRHLAPLFRVSPRLLWCNAATMLDWTLREAGGAAIPAARAATKARLDAPLDGCGRRNAMCGAVCEIARARGPEPQRRVCCLRYLLPGVPGCGDLCPLPEVSGRAGPAPSTCKAEDDP